MEQPWGRLLLSQKLWCNTWTDAPLQLADKRYRFGYAKLTTLLSQFTKTKLTAGFHNHFTEQNADIQFTKEIEGNGKLPFLDCLVSRGNSRDELRTTVYRKPKHTNRLLDESSYNPNLHKATTIKTLARRVQLVCDTPDSLRDENRYLEHVFHKNIYNLTLTILDETFTDLLRLMLRTGTRHLLLQWLYLTLRALLRPSHESYSPTASMEPKNLQLRYDTYWPMLKTGTNSTTDREQSTRLNAPTARLPTLVRLVETLTTRLTESKRATRNGDANNHIAVHHQLTNYNIDWDSAAQFLTYSTNYFQPTDSRKLIH